MGWITTLLASGPARKALSLMLAALTIALFLLNLCRAGRLAERLSRSDKNHEIQSHILDATTSRPADSEALSDRLRDGRF